MADRMVSMVGRSLCIVPLFAWRLVAQAPATTPIDGGVDASRIYNQRFE